MHKSLHLFAALCLPLFVFLFPAVQSVQADLMTYNGSGNSGFGGVIGTGNLQLDDDGTTISGTVNRGAGGFNDVMVIYLDTGAGGFTDTTSFNDQADTLRKGISGVDGANRATINFAAGFDADYAIALAPDGGVNFGGLWQLAAGADNSLAFVDSVNLTPTGAGTATSATSYSFSFDWAEIGLTSTDSVDFVATYLNGNNAFRSDEAVGDGVSTPNPGNPSTTTFTNALTYSGAAAVPEPASLGFLMFLGATALVGRRKLSA